MQSFLDQTGTQTGGSPSGLLTLNDSPGSLNGSSKEESQDHIKKWINKEKGQFLLIPNDDHAEVCLVAYDERTWANWFRLLDEAVPVFLWIISERGWDITTGQPSDVGKPTIAGKSITENWAQFLRERDKAAIYDYLCNTAKVANGVHKWKDTVYARILEHLLTTYERLRWDEQKIQREKEAKDTDCPACYKSDPEKGKLCSSHAGAVGILPLTGGLKMAPNYDPSNQFFPRIEEGDKVRIGHTGAEWLTVRGWSSNGQLVLFNPQSPQTGFKSPQWDVKAVIWTDPSRLHTKKATKLGKTPQSAR